MFTTTLRDNIYIYIYIYIMIICVDYVSLCVYTGACVSVCVSVCGCVYSCNYAISLNIHINLIHCTPTYRKSAIIPPQPVCMHAHGRTKKEAYEQT
jgi:hypothetical protein